MYLPSTLNEDRVCMCFLLLFFSNISLTHETTALFPVMFLGSVTTKAINGKNGSSAINIGGNASSGGCQQKPSKSVEHKKFTDLLLETSLNLDNTYILHPKSAC